MKATQQIFRTFEPVVFAAALFLLLLHVHGTNAQEVRTWVDSSGQFKIEASYEKLESGNVFLKMPDGSIKQIPLTMLSTGDQDRIRDLNAPAEPAKSADAAETPNPSPTEPTIAGSSVPVSETMPATNSENSRAVRTWVDSSGQYKIKASYQKFENNNVFLKLPDGQIKQIPFSMLSDGDKARVSQLNAVKSPALKTAEMTPAPIAAQPSPTPVKPTPVKPTPVKPTPVKPTPVKPTPAEATPVKPTTAEATTVKSAMAEATTAEAAPMPVPTAKPASADLAASREMAPAKEMAPSRDIAPAQEMASATNLKPAAEIALEADLLPKKDLEPPKPVIQIGQRIGDLDINNIVPPNPKGGNRANPKYLLPVQRSELALLPKDFQGAALLLLDEPNNPRKAIPALDYLRVKWPKNRQPVLLKLVINCASSDHKYNREVALAILSNRDSDQSFPYILARIDDTSFTIRSLAYQMLRQMGDRRAIEPLARRFPSDDVDRISSLLRSFGSASETAIMPHLTHEDPDIRLRACNLLGKIGTEKSLPALQEMAGREQTMVLKAQTRSSINKIKRRKEKKSQ